MKIELIITKNSYYFCGSVSLNITNTLKNPLVVELDTLNKQEILGLNKANNTKVIQIVSGLEEFSAKVKELHQPKKVVTTPAEEKPVIVVEEEKVETIETVKTETLTKEVPEVVEQITEEDKTVEEAVKPTVRKKPVVKK